ADTVLLASAFLVLLGSFGEEVLRIVFRYSPREVCSGMSREKRKNGKIKADTVLLASAFLVLLGSFSSFGFFWRRDFEGSFSLFSPQGVRWYVERKTEKWRN
ncbi:MAG: hypothetical protein J6J66_04105, partial [Clostridia bacterium]|nr:hypothetical protein [Clostridia bacterium]